MKVYVVYMEADWREAGHLRQDYEVIGIYREKHDADARCFYENKKNNDARCENTGKLVYQVEEYDLL